MKIFYTTIVMALLTISTFAQAPPWQWARSGGGALDDVAYSVTTDSSGNVYAAGSFYSTTILFGTFLLTNADNTGSTADIFIVKYDAGGNVIWAQRAGGSGRDEAQSITSDVSGHLLVAGYFQSPTMVLGSTTLNNGGGQNMFVAKYDANGNAIWAKSASCQGNFTSSVTTDISGNVFVTATFLCSSFTLGSYTLTNTGVYDVYLVKYDSNGNVLWAKSGGGSGSDISFSVAVDSSGNSYIAGFFDGASIGFGSETLYSSGTGNDMFLVKYDVNGNVIWARTPGGSSDDVAFSVATDASGNILVTGYYLFGPSVIFGAFALPYVNGADIFVAKYAADGNVLWAKSIAGNNDDVGYSITTDNYNDVYVAGYFASSTLPFGSTTITLAGGYDLFLAKYDYAGNEIFAKSTGGLKNETAYSVTACATGTIYLSGYFKSPVVIFDSALTNVDPTGIKSDMFIAKLDSSLLVGAFEISKDENGIIIYPNPANETLFINQKRSSDPFITLELFDITGKLHLKSELGKEQSIDLRQLASGFYILRLTNDSETLTKKIIKE